MTDEELIARLRDFDKVTVGDARVAADRIEALTAELATCEKYRDAYDEMGRIGTQAVRDLEAKLAKTEGLLAMAMHVIKGRIHWEASGLTCDCGECQALVATVAQIEGESHE